MLFHENADYFLVEGSRNLVGVIIIKKIFVFYLAFSEQVGKEEGDAERKAKHFPLIIINKMSKNK